MNLTIKMNTDKKYLQFWNSLFNLTTREIEVLATFLKVNRKAKHKNLCSYENKIKVADILKMDDKNKLNNYIKRFKDKGVITLKDNNYVPHKLIRTKQQINVKVVRSY